MQKSDATPGSLQNPVSDQFWDHFGRVPAPKSTKNRKKGFPKRMRKKCRFLACEKKPKSGPKRVRVHAPGADRGSPAACAAPPGGLGGCIYTCNEFCKRFYAMNFAKDFMQRSLLAFSTPAGAADLIASRIPPGRVKFGCWVIWLLGCWVVGHNHGTGSVLQLPFVAWSSLAVPTPLQ